MPSCLGIYIESNLIKYAKVSRERETIKLDAYGVKFYEQLDESIEQIINETFSYNIPISINVRDEQYNYFDIFSLLNEKDVSKAIDTEFELLCEEKGYNKSTFDSKYILVNNIQDRDKEKTIHISCNKAETSRLIQQFQKYKLKSVTPLPVAIINDLEIGVKENSAILNLEEQITLTTIINGQINKVSVLSEGMDKIYEKINKKENSYAKVYDILKNSTIYTSEGKELLTDGDSYLEDIMPTLYNVVSEVKDNLMQNINSIEKLYITGTGAVINNIDLYFQEFLLNTKCEILKPYFTKNNSINMSNIRDYIEVNSATALGLQGLGEGIKNINFKNGSLSERLKELSKMEIKASDVMNKLKDKGPRNNKAQNPSNSKLKLNFNNDLNEKLDGTEAMLLRFAGLCAIVILVFVIASSIIRGMINQKINEADDVISDTKSQITKIGNDTQKITDKTTKYNTLIRKLDEINQKIADQNSVKNSIPNLLSRIMAYVPKDLQVTLIKNTTSKHIVINVLATEYDPIGYFLGAINNNGILVNAGCSSSVKQNGIIIITIEGDMP